MTANGEKINVFGMIDVVGPGVVVSSVALFAVNRIGASTSDVGYASSMGVLLVWGPR